ncbi:hypothetical protein LCGC14_2727790 [marine sediment metagenome]|uniref:Uncharacterized protein n=1 Tax=marine sediment metagenome TaxID=412755 RepID=A0A0F8ZVL1_9ZZZZ
MSEILGSYSDNPRSLQTWGKFRGFADTFYYYCCECWSGIGYRVLRRASSDIACCACNRTDVRNRLKINEAAD